MRPGRYMKHNDLFLVRFWTEEPGPGDQTASIGAGMDWHGRVQRVVDGESREFTDWEAFVDTIRAMLTTPPPIASSSGGANAAQAEPHPGPGAKGEM
jgi:hypothetical protein